MRTSKGSGRFVRVFLGCLALVFPCSLQGELAKAPLNIVLILADDLGYGSLGCYGAEQIKTPCIDRLASKGIRLTDFHSNGPMCTPTRAALMTGRYQQRCAWVDDAELSAVFREQRKNNMKQRWAWGISLEEVTIADLLKRAGYRTGLIGKWHLGYDSKFHPMNQGFDEFRGYISGAVDYHTHVATSGSKKLDWWNGRVIQNEEGYATDLLTGYARDFIARNRERPFFLYLSQEAPHTPVQGRNLGVRKSQEETYKEMIEVLDESVGVVMDELHKHALEENTLVVFCSDNGPQVTYLSAAGVLRGKKGSMFEGGHRVPFIASWPGVIPEGSSSDETVMTMDILPTFTKLAGVQLPVDLKVDGVDLMPSLKGSDKVKERALHWRFANSWAVRRGEWKLIGRGEKPQVLVNLKTDLKEEKNQLNDEPKRVEELMKLHAQWIQEVGGK